MRPTDLDEHGDLAWDDENEVYVIPEIADRGYDTDRVMEQVFPRGDDGYWKKTVNTRAGGTETWFNHEEYDDAYARFRVNGDFELGVPEMWKQSQYDEIESYLRTGITAMGDTKDGEMQHPTDFFLEWLYEPSTQPLYS